MPDQIFISYRRNDAAYVTGHINDLLRKEFGDEAVFTDVDNIALGVDFRTVIDEMVSQCQVFLAVIGSDWLTVRDQEGNPRLQDPADFVRIEVESALRRNIPVIPLLVSGAQMPAPEDLPESLKNLAFRNGTHIRPGPDFTVDVDRLVKNLRRHFDAIRTEARGGSATQAKTEPHPGDVLQEASSAPEAATGEVAPPRPRKTPAVRINVADDERARKRAELGIGQQKKRQWAAPVWVTAIVIGAGAGWYYVDQNPGAIESLLTTIGTQMSGTENGTDAVDGAGPEGDAVGTEGADVFAPTSFSPATVIEAGESPGADSDIDATAGSDTESEIESAADAVAIENLTDSIAAATTDAAKAVPAGDLAATIAEPVATPADEISDRLEVAKEAVDGTETGLTESVDAMVDSNAGDEVTLTPGSQRQSDASALISEGVRFAGVGDHEAAIQNFTEALPLEFEQAFVYKQRGASYQALGQFEAAIQDYDQSIALNSEDLITVYKRGVSHIALQNYESAIADFDLAIVLDPEFVDAYSRRADVHEALGNEEAATRDRAVVSVFDSNRDNRR